MIAAVRNWENPKNPLGKAKICHPPRPLEHLRGRGAEQRQLQPGGFTLSTARGARAPTPPLGKVVGGRGEEPGPHVGCGGRAGRAVPGAGSGRGPGRAGAGRARAPAPAARSAAERDGPNWNKTNGALYRPKGSAPRAAPAERGGNTARLPDLLFQRFEIIFNLI